MIREHWLTGVVVAFGFAWLVMCAATMAHGESPGITAGSDGQCICWNNGKSWPCRKAVDYSKPITCNSNLNLRLVCPEDKNELCTYINSSTCSEPSVISVCYAADEPK